MGEVYRARDTRLERTVAIKILNSQLAGSSELRARFEREARVISQLQHPNICVLHDIGRDGSTDFLVMEFLEGESLAQRLAKGRVGIQEVLKIGIEIADGLDKAHRAGVTHRDLKPGNIMLTRSGAKLLDFGLAKPAGTAASGSGSSAPLLSAVATATSPSPQLSPLTAHGAVVGTVQYMSPEQIEGKEADARSDIFAFGAVLYEMTTGKRPFEGKSQVSIASAILEKDPEPVSALQPAAPPPLSSLVATCLAKNPDDRFTSAHDIKLQLQSMARTGTQPQSAGAAARKSFAATMAWAAASALVLICAVLAIWIWHGTRNNASAPIKAFVPAPPDTQLLAYGFGRGPVTVSPDGTRLAFSAIERDGVIRLWVRQLDTSAATPVQGTEDARAPFWSPDGRSLGFWADGKLKSVDPGTGTETAICDVPVVYFSASWGAQGKIIFSNRGELGVVPASGGTPTPVKFVAGDDSLKMNPIFLPDGDHFLYDNTSRGSIEMSSVSSGSVAVVLENAAQPQYAAGQLLFSREGKIFGQPFDPSSGKVSRSAVALIDDSNYSAGGPVLAYHPHAPFGQMQWYDMTGKPAGAVGTESRVLGPRISPDGKRVAFLLSPSGKQEEGRDYWVRPLQGGVANRLTFEGDSHWPAWSPDGKYIAYAKELGGRTTIARKPADGSGAEEVLLRLESPWASTVDWSPDGRYLSYDCYNAKENHWEMWILPLFGDRKPFRPVPSNSESQYDGNFSPDGHWLAYFADNGRPDVFVIHFPEPGGKYQISTSGGFDVAWDKLNHLFYLTTGDMLVEADLELSPQSLQVLANHRMFQLPLPDTAARLFDVSADGKRLLAVTPTDPEANSIGLLLNWTALLTK
jgi:serine/threonine protein kinase